MSKSVPQKIATCMLAFLLAGTLSAANAAPLGQQNQSPAPATSQQQAQPSDAQNRQPANRPLGTAVAPGEKSSGVTASRPAGAVIAPAKQRRIRAIFIKIAVVAGAGAAIGAVVLLSHGSPSQPH